MQEVLEEVLEKEEDENKLTFIWSVYLYSFLLPWSLLALVLEAGGRWHLLYISCCRLCSPQPSRQLLSGRLW